MWIEYSVGGFLAVLMLGYLIYALLWPDRF
jgi:K+-transporting ATPase KdpF subunit